MNPLDSPSSSDRPSVSGSRDVTETSDSFAETKNQIKETARDAAAKVKNAASQTATRARDEPERIATEKKETAAGRIGSYSSAIHETARALEEKDPNIAWLTHQAADKLQNVAEYMRNRDLSSLRHDAEDIARRHPAAFYGGMFLAGVLAGNLVKASRKKVDDNFDDDPQRETIEQPAGTPFRGEGKSTASGLPGAERAASGS